MPIATQRGALLLDALAAAAVLSFGVLGTVSLHAQAIRHIQGAQYRSEAVRLAHALVGRMWTEDPALLAERYDDRAGGAGYAAFSRLTHRLPGAELPGNAPEVRVEPGPLPASRKVTIKVQWQLPGEPAAHRYGVTAVVSRN